ncbi:MAG: GcrA family cell cycle regulator [Pseudomonadota bacterium]
MSWNDERVELLKKLWGEGRSASKIAKELGGVTRNAVIGKVHRLGLSNRLAGSTSSRDKNAVKPSEKKLAHKAVQKVIVATVVRGKSTIPVGQPLPPQPSANEISKETLASHREMMKSALQLDLMELTERTCKWPIGDPATDVFSFCGLPVEPGKPYCKSCAEVAYQKSTGHRDRKR